MQICCLMENTALSDAFEKEHGLSLHIETEAYRLLFDFGAGDGFLRNAHTLGLDLADVQMAVLSHGHYDHGGGLNAFLACNTQATVYLQGDAAAPYYARRESGQVEAIGIPGSDGNSRLQGQRIVFVPRVYRLNKQMLLFSDVKASYPAPRANATLLALAADSDPANPCYVSDAFTHEQSLIIEEGQQAYLIAGCAHRGILNIVERATVHLGYTPHVVIGGFHLPGKHPEYRETEAEILQLGEKLLQTGAMYYTGHCTGAEAYRTLKTVMGERLSALTTGLVVNF